MSQACGPFLHCHSQQHSLAHAPLTLSLLPPSYEDLVGTLGSPGNLHLDVFGGAFI